MARPIKVVVVDTDGDLILDVGKEVNLKTEDKDAGTLPTSATPVRVSSKILTLSSPVFKAMFTGKFREGYLALSQTNPPVVELPEDEVLAMLRLCRILHHKESPLVQVSFASMHRVAIASDKYQCGSAVVPWFHRHLQLKSRYIGQTDLAHAVNTAYLLDDKEAFYKFSQCATMYLSEAIKNSPFAKDFSPSLHDRLIESLSSLRSTKMHDLNMNSQWSIQELFAVYDDRLRGARARIKDMSGDLICLPEVCKGEATRVGNFISSLCIVGLWPNEAAREPKMSLHDAVCLIRRVAYTLWSNGRHG
ncbi:hypothetical protein A1O1_04701 [Capronia coronata CBS 617.96]|uniref:BTB domain-containing protein n=1 Tax=Capronia coronata CBS 617.96 TaxID=1182541 RepID=W9YZQ0_9EURO|nr:uncharacterized protein A1O1_04701 [Capronia coronata CBS 617.96]EXJ87774.1 hypothetical protein A1O1_04701 [Capronia coronata CBS 617.96]